MEESEPKEIENMTIKELKEERHRIYVIIATKPLTAFMDEYYGEKIKKIEKELRARGEF